MDARAKRSLTIRANKLYNEGVPAAELNKRLGISPDKWRFKPKGTKAGGSEKRVHLMTAEQYKAAKKTQGSRRGAVDKIVQVDEQTKKKADRKVKAIRSRGRNADHIRELWQTNETYMNSTPEEFNRTLKAYPQGNDPRNIQSLTEEQNIAKRAGSYRVQRALKRMETKSPSTSYQRVGTGGAPAVQAVRPSSAMGAVREDLEVGTRSEQLGFIPIDPVRAAVDMLGNLRID